MILVHVVIAVATLLMALVQGVDLLQVYEGLVHLSQTLHWGVYAWIVVLCCLLVLLTVILEQMKSYGLMYLMAKSLLELSLLAVSILNFFALFFAWKYLKNLWLEMMPVNLLPFLGVFVAMVMVQLFDFNYPYKKRVLFGALLTMLTIVLVTIHLM